MDHHGLTMSQFDAAIGFVQIIVGLSKATMRHDPFMNKQI